MHRSVTTPDYDMMDCAPTIHLAVQACGELPNEKAAPQMGAASIKAELGPMAQRIDTIKPFGVTTTQRPS
jgi:hypothetical protein